MERKADWLPAVSSNVRALSECCDLSEAGHHFGYRNLSIARLLDDLAFLFSQRASEHSPHQPISLHSAVLRPYSVVFITGERADHAGPG